MKQFVCRSLHSGEKNLVFVQVDNEETGMFDQIITECKIFNPTLERAFKIAPKEFVPAYQWFIDHEDSEIDKLPHRLNDK